MSEAKYKIAAVLVPSDHQGTVFATLIKMGSALCNNAIYCTIYILPNEHLGHLLNFLP
jgi:hypothetical protein